MFNFQKILLMMKYLFILIFINLALVSGLNAQQTQQGIVITGVLTDDAGDPLPGASILVKGSIGSVNK